MYGTLPTFEMGCEGGIKNTSRCQDVKKILKMNPSGRNYVRVVQIEDVRTGRRGVIMSEQVDVV